MDINNQLLAKAAFTSYPDYPDQVGVTPPLDDGFVWDSRIQDSSVGLDAHLWRRDNADGTTDYILSLVGTEKSTRDAWTDINYGWPQFQALQNDVRYVSLLTEATNNESVSIHFTGHSLGGGLAQYAAYQFAETVDVSRLALTTFNALGGVAGLIKNESYDASRVASLDADLLCNRTGRCV